MRALQPVGDSGCISTWPQCSQHWLPQLWTWVTFSHRKGIMSGSWVPHQATKSKMQSEWCHGTNPNTATHLLSGPGAQAPWAPQLPESQAPPSVWSLERTSGLLLLGGWERLGLKKARWLRRAVGAPCEHQTRSGFREDWLLGRWDSTGRDGAALTGQISGHRWPVVCVATSGDSTGSCDRRLTWTMGEAWSQHPKAVMASARDCLGHVDPETAS